MTNAPMVFVDSVLARKDNYIHLLRLPHQGIVIAVDPSTFEDTERYLRLQDLKLGYIFSTHHHDDHVAGNLALKEKYGCTIVGSYEDRHRIPGIDQSVQDGETFVIGGLAVHAIAIPGHTIGHMAYHIPSANLLFCGDTLFSLGSGRLFEGTPTQMWTSLQKLMNLPDDTLVYCGHEYTEANARFALAVDPDNRALRDYAHHVQEQRIKLRPTVPSLLGQEKRLNPFLRPFDAGIRKTLAMPQDDEIAVFAELRHRKNNF